MHDLSVELRSKNQLFLDRISNLMDDVDELKLKISQLVAQNEGAGIKKGKKRRKKTVDGPKEAAPSKDVAVSTRTHTPHVPAGTVCKSSSPNPDSTGDMPRSS